MTRGSARRPRRVGGGALLVLVAGLAALPAAARAAELPAGLAVGGRLEVTAANDDAGIALNTLYGGAGVFDPYRLSLELSGAPAEGFQVLTRTDLTDLGGAQVYGAYLLYTPRPDRDLQLLAGKIPWVIGTWSARAEHGRQPLIGVPLLYQYPSRLPARAPVPTADSLLELPDGPDAYGFGSRASAGMPVVDEAWWDAGVALAGSLRPLELAVGVTNGTPGAPRAARDPNDAKSVLGRIGLAPAPGLRFGISGAWGAYLPRNAVPAHGAGAGQDHQRLLLADLELLAGHAEVHGEGVLNAWETPALGVLRVRGGYGEAKVTLAPGLYAAGRYDLLRFSRVRTSAGASRPWSDDVDRLESGLGWRVTRAATLKAVWQHTALDEVGGRERYDLAALQAVLTF